MENKVKGILRKPNDDKKKNNDIKWDEEGIAEWDKQRGQCKYHINEPDTPYNYYDPELDKELENEDFDPEIIKMAKHDFTKQKKEIIMKK